MKLKYFIIVVMSLAMISRAQVYGQSASEAKDDWVLLGTRTVDYLIDHDEVDLKNGNENLSSLKFTVRNGTLNMHKCTIHFTDGETTNLDFSDNSTGPAAERIVDLKGSHRSIDKVTFWYDTKTNSDNKAVLEVWGKS
ncbi:MAG TPA: hypothetical protein VFW11_07940 [Cyclobacteriaceae bacterium]|nr:hypothetical protein [Cyclobacteriaceae bacterium]